MIVIVTSTSLCSANKALDGFPNDEIREGLAVRAAAGIGLEGRKKREREEKSGRVSVGISSGLLGYTGSGSGTVPGRGNSFAVRGCSFVSIS